MTEENIIKKLKKIFREVLENADIEIDENSSADNISDWDSLNHIYIIVAIEETFNKKFTAEEISHWKSVGDIIKSLK